MFGRIVELDDGYFTENPKYDGKIKFSKIYKFENKDIYIGYVSNTVFDILYDSELDVQDMYKVQQMINALLENRLKMYYHSITCQKSNKDIHMIEICVNKSLDEFRQFYDKYE